MTEQPERQTVDEKLDSALGAAIEEHDPFTEGDAEGDAEPEGEAGEPEAEAPEYGEDLQDSAEEEAEESEEEADEDEEEGEEQASAEAEEPDEPEDEGAAREREEIALHRAYTTLHEQGVPFSVLKKTAKATLIAWAERVDAAGKPKGDPASGEDAEPARGAKGERQEAPSKKALLGLDWRATSKAMADELGVDEQSAERAFRPAFESLEKAVAERLEALETAQLEQAGRAAISANVQRLEAKYGKALAGNPEKRERLIARAERLAKAGGYESAEQVFDEAAILELGEVRPDYSQKRRNGVSTPPSRLGGFGEPASDEDEDFQRRMDLVEAGRFEQARALPPPLRTKKKPAR